MYAAAWSGSAVRLRRQRQLIPERSLGSEHGDDAFGGVQFVDAIEAVELVGPYRTALLGTDNARSDAGDVDLGPAALLDQRLGQPGKRGERPGVGENRLTLREAAGRRDVCDQAIAPTLAQQRHCRTGH